MSSPEPANNDKPNKMTKPTKTTKPKKKSKLPKEFLRLTDWDQLANDSTDEEKESRRKQQSKQPTNGKKPQQKLNQIQKKKKQLANNQLKDQKGNKKHQITLGTQLWSATLNKNQKSSLYLHQQRKTKERKPKSRNHTKEPQLYTFNLTAEHQELKRECDRAQSKERTRKQKIKKT